MGKGQGYNRRAARFIKKHPDLLAQYEKPLKLLELDPFHPFLRLHRMKGSLKGLHSVSINVSYRITLELLINDQKIILVDIGSHYYVYR